MVRLTVTFNVNITSVALHLLLLVDQVCHPIGHWLRKHFELLLNVLQLVAINSDHFRLKLKITGLCAQFFDTYWLILLRELMVICVLPRLAEDAHFHQFLSHLMD